MVEEVCVFVCCLALGRERGRDVLSGVWCRASEASRGRKVVVRSDEQRGLHAVRNRKRRRVREFCGTKAIFGRGTARASQVLELTRAWTLLKK